MEYTGKLDNISDEDLMAQIMGEGGEPVQQEQQPSSPEEHLSIVIEEQQKTALAAYHLRMMDAGAIMNPETGQIDPNTIEPVIAEFAALEYTTNMGKIAAQQEKVLNNFNLIQNERTLTSADKLMVKQNMVDRDSWPMHISSMKVPKKAKEADLAKKMKESEATFDKYLDKDSMYAKDAKITKGKNRVVPLAICDKGGVPVREATPFETAQYFHNREQMEQHPIYERWQKFSGSGAIGTGGEEVLSEYSREDLLGEYRRLGGSGTEAGKKFAGKFLTEK